MNEIIKFTDYKTINENVIIPVVDVVIGNNGLLKTNRNDLPLKGIVELRTSKYIDPTTGLQALSVPRGTQSQSGKPATRKEVAKIKGQDGLDYPGGLDKNGNLVGVHFDENNNLMTGTSSTRRQSRKILIDPSIYNLVSDQPQQGLFWNKNVDYIKCVPSTPTGWVNVKVDMEVIKRVRRYSSGLVDQSKVSNNTNNVFEEKLKILSDISKSTDKVTNISREIVQKQMSAIILLHYVNEIKTFFTPSTSGLLFESFLGGLIPYAKVTEDNGKADISVPTSAGNVEYQVKLYSENTKNIDIALKDKVDFTLGHSKGEIPLDFYLICIKKGDTIDIYLLDNIHGSERYYGDFKSSSNTNTKDGAKQTFSLSKLSKKSSILEGNSGKFTLNLSNLEGKISIMGRGIKKSLDDLYLSLSDFQYNIETIITGVDEKSKKVMDDSEFDIHSNKAIDNLGKMDKVLSKLISSIRTPTGK